MIGDSVVFMNSGFVFHAMCVLLIVCSVFLVVA